MIAKVCDICGKIETPDKVRFHTLTHEYGIFMTKKVESFHICPKCMNLLKESRSIQKEKSEVRCATCDVSDINCHEQCREVVNGNE